MNIRKNFFTLRVTEHWNRLTREVVESPLEIFNTHLDAFLFDLIWGMCFGMAVGVGDVPSNPYISVIL